MNSSKSPHISYYLRLLWIWIFFAPYLGSLLAQELPPVVNYPTEVYGAANQNWAISQDKNNIIYVANNDGLLSYNGARWTLYPSPNKTVIRSVKVIGDRVYTGSYMDFGFWTKDPTGRLSYTSLSAQLQLDLKEDEEFWKIIDYGSWVVFQSLDTIYSYDAETETISIIGSENTIHRTYVIDDTLFFQVNREGLYKVEGGEKQLISDFKVFQEDVVVAAFGYNEQILCVTSGNGFFLLDGGDVSPWNESFSEEHQTATIYSCIPLKDGTMFIGTVSEGVFQLSARGEKLMHINKYSGLDDNTVLSIFQDTEENVWLGLDNGIDCINLKTPFRNYIDRVGALGTVYTSIVHRDHIYLGTNQGLFVKLKGSVSNFTLVPGTIGQVWSLDVIEETLFCGHNAGTFIVSDGVGKQIAKEMGTWGVKQVPGHPDILLQGNYNGLYILERSDTEAMWTIRNKIEGFDISSRYFELVSSGDILVSHEYKGVYMLDIDTDFRKVLSYSTKQEIDKAANSSLTKYDGKVFYGNDAGIYQFEEQQQLFVQDTLLSNVFLNDKYISGKLIAKDDYLWAFTENYIHYVKKEKLNNAYKLNQIPIPLNLRKEMKGFENVSGLAANQFLMGTSNGYLLIDLGANFESDYRLMIDMVQTGETLDNMRYVRTDTLLKLSPKENNVNFEFSVPEYEKFLIAEYSHRLKREGVSTSWSLWTSNPSIQFSSLASGTYEFEVKAKVNNNELAEAALFSFEIAKPWYATNLAVISYILSFVLIVFLVNTLYTNYYKKEQRRVLDESEREGKLRELESQQEIIQLKNESLHQDIEARNRELAIATMSMVNGKNQLNNIKDALESIEGSPVQIQPIIQLINENLESKDDWKFFEEAFNHADKDFFKRIKEVHPNLTPNDLRLCVYLRLNLSSKEIAPLLNISPRSVEIKRYRLRKKIDLDTSINLNDYFIKI